MKSTEETRAHAQEIFDIVNEYPEKHSQSAWGSSGNDCGTICCIAGWSTLLKGQSVFEGFALKSHYDSSGMNFLDPAAENLGLDEFEAKDLFFDESNESAVQKLKHIIVGEDWL